MSTPYKERGLLKNIRSYISYNAGIFGATDNKLIEEILAKLDDALEDDEEIRVGSYVRILKGPEVGLGFSANTIGVVTAELMNGSYQIEDLAGSTSFVYERDQIRLLPITNPPKFKAGDSVIVAKGVTRGFPAGTVGVIEKGPGFYCDLHHHDYAKEWWYKVYSQSTFVDGYNFYPHLESDLEPLDKSLPRFSLGDMVEVTGNHLVGFEVGTAGYIVDVQPDERHSRAYQVYAPLDHAYDKYGWHLESDLATWQREIEYGANFKPELTVSYFRSYTFAQNREKVYLGQYDRRNRKIIGCANAEVLPNGGYCDISFCAKRLVGREWRMMFALSSRSVCSPKDAYSFSVARYVAADRFMAEFAVGLGTSWMLTKEFQQIVKWALKCPLEYKKWELK